MIETTWYEHTWEFDTWEKFLSVNQEVCSKTGYTTYFARMTLEELTELCGGTWLYKKDFHLAIRELRRMYRKGESIRQHYWFAHIHNLIRRDGVIKSTFGVSDTSYDKTFHVHPGYGRLILVGSYSEPVDVIIHSKHPQSYDPIEMHPEWFEPGTMNLGVYQTDRKRQFLDVVQTYPGSFHGPLDEMSDEEKWSHFTFGEDYVLFKNQPFALIKNGRWTVSEINS